MAERVHAAAPGDAAPTPPYTGASRAAYASPQPAGKHRRRRSCRRRCCCWFSVILVVIVLLLLIAGASFYLICRPQKPTFSIASLRPSDPSLDAPLNVSVSAHNPNKKLAFLYDTISITASTDAGVRIGDGFFPAFDHEPKETVLLETWVTGSGPWLEDLKEMQMETKARVKVGSLKTDKVRVTVFCDGFAVAATTPTYGGAQPPPPYACQVKIQVKIFKWYV